MTFISIALIHFLACMTPGIALIYALSVLSHSNIKNASKVLLGITFCNGIEIILSILGVSFLAMLSKKLPAVVYLVAGLVVLYLGIQNLLLSFKKNNGKNTVQSDKKYITHGFVLTLLNPKVLLFWPIVLAPIALQYNMFQKVLAMVYFTVMTFVFLFGIVYVASLGKTKVVKYLKYTQRFFGVLMLFFGVGLIWHIV